MDDAPTQRVVALEPSLLECALRASAERLDALPDGDVAELGASARRLGRRQVLARLPDACEVRYRACDPHGHWRAPDLLQLTCRSERSGAGGRRHALRSSPWRRRDGQWPMLFPQGTPIVGGAWNLPWERHLDAS